MKNIRLVILVIFCFLIIDVKAEAMPHVISHQVMVTNKDGVVCYHNGKKSDEVIPYKTMLTASYDIVGNYINVVNDKYDCDVNYSGVSANNQKFDLDTKGTEIINQVRAIVLPSTGLNLRIGPSVTYTKIITIPQNAIITLTHKAGIYWYYTEYNGKSGWVTAMNNYIGFDYNNVLINYEKTKIYSNNGKTVLGTIPEDTEITDYIKLESINEDDFKYYVIYNGTKGYIKDMLYKTDTIGKIKLLKEVEIKDEKGNPIKKMTRDSELEYTMVNDNNAFYFPEKKALLNLDTKEYEYITKAKTKIKDKGYIGEGIFGEEKKERDVKSLEKEVEDDTIENKDDPTNVRDIIIICLLGGILVALIILVIIKIKNNKKLNASIDKI